MCSSDLRMTRQFVPGSLTADDVVPLVDLARRAPSAGYSQGVHFVVLDGTALAGFWQVTGAAEWFADVRPGVLDAPVVVLPLADPDAYTSRYAAPDKAGHGLEVAANWEPWRTVATWYMWRSLDPLPVTY